MNCASASGAKRKRIGSPTSSQAPLLIRGPLHAKHAACLAENHRERCNLERPAPTRAVRLQGFGCLRRAACGLADCDA